MNIDALARVAKDKRLNSVGISNLTGLNRKQVAKILKGRGFLPFYDVQRVANCLGYEFFLILKQ
jgi:hypothetical protein